MCTVAVMPVTVILLEAVTVVAPDMQLAYRWGVCHDTAGRHSEMLSPLNVCVPGFFLVM